MKKILLPIVLTIGMQPLVAVDIPQPAPCVVDLYNAVKNRSHFFATFGWPSGQEKAAVVAAQDAGISAAAAYVQAYEYAYEKGDACTAVTLKNSFAAQNMRGLPTLAILWMVVVAGFKLVNHRLKKVSHTYAAIEDLRARLPAFQVFNEMLREIDQPQMVPQGFHDKGDIRRKYNILSRRWHPDRNRGNEERAAEKFRRVDEAYKSLINGPHAQQNND